jgi:hypothetical protein
MTLPKWAQAMKYEYDLGMSSSCEHCGDALPEGSIVWKDTEARNAYYCSEACVLKAEGTEDTQP